MSHRLTGVPAVMTAGTPTLRLLEAKRIEPERSAVLGDSSHDLIACAFANLGLDLQGDADVRAQQARQMLYYSEL